MLHCWGKILSAGDDVHPYFICRIRIDGQLGELNFFWLNYAYGIYQLMLNEIVWKSYAP